MLNKIALIVSVLCCGSVFSFNNYEPYLPSIWSCDSKGYRTDSRESFFPKDMKSFLEQAEGRVLVAFYPKNSGFDQLVEDPSAFWDVGEFMALVREMDFQIHSIQRQGYFVSFDGIDELQAFVWEAFGSDLKEQDPPLQLCSKIILAELERVDVYN